jgi:WD40 repeat protein
VCAAPQGLRTRLWKLDGPKPRIVFEGHPHGHAFSPDGQQFAATYADGSLRLYDTATGAELKRHRIPKDHGPWPCWNPRQPLIAVCYPTSYWILNLETGEGRAGAKVPGGIDGVDWSPDGRTLATSGSAGLGLPAITLWDAAAGKQALPPLEGHKTGGLMLRYSPGGNRLLSTDWSATWRLWDTQTGQQLLTMYGGGAWLRFHPDNDLAGIGAVQTRLRLFRFQAGDEARTVARRGKPGQGDYRDWAMRPLDREGRLVAVSARTGLAIVDVIRGEEVALLPRCIPVQAEPGGALITRSAGGLWRWPVAVDPQTGRRRYGPPRRLPLPGAPAREVGSNADGRVLAVPLANGSAVVLFPAEGRVVPLGPQSDVRHAAVSPDGRWVATGSHSVLKGVGAQVWEAASGRLACALPVPGLCFVRFSPDRKWLLTTGGGYRLWSVDGWKEGPALAGEGAGAFSPDGSLLALQDEPGVVRLVAPATGKELARLTAPEPEALQPHCFAADGTLLVCLNVDREALQIFDLRRIRGRLAALGLDWDALPYPAAAGAGKPQTFEFVGVDLIDPQAAATELNNQAWRLVTGPAEQRDPEAALEPIQQALKHRPNDPNFLNTLGVVQYRRRQYAAAVAALEKSLANAPGQHDGVNLFFLAMCHARLGAGGMARDCFDRAVRWLEGRRGLPARQVEELQTYRAEAAVVLGLK